MLGIRAVVAQSYERIHRSNLIGMGVLPLEFLPGEGAESLGLDGRETYDLEGIAELVERFEAGRELVRRRRPAIDQVERLADPLCWFIRQTFQPTGHRQRAIVAVLGIQKGERLGRHGRFVAPFATGFGSRAIEDLQQWETSAPLAICIDRAAIALVAAG